MTVGSMIEVLPAPDRWDFGSHPYGLEPLTLPATGSDVTAENAEPRPELAEGDLESSVRSLHTATSTNGEAQLLIPEPTERIFWFRWITGHQVTFILWQLLARSLSARKASGSSPANLDGCRVFVRGYSIMLLYTGSCPRDVYLRVIRPAMILHHPGFSGAWASDFRPIRSMLAPYAVRRAPDSPFTRECALNNLIHEGIATKLVPDGPSLLQTAIGQQQRWQQHNLAALFDAFFFTLRAQVSHQAVVLQLMRRLHAIARDIASNGLYPSFASSADEKPPSLQTRDVSQCERTISETLLAIATEAIRST